MKGKLWDEAVAGIDWRGVDFKNGWPRKLAWLKVSGKLLSGWSWELGADSSAFGCNTGGAACGQPVEGPLAAACDSTEGPGGEK